MQIMRLLLHASADVDLQAQNGCTALHNAAANGHEASVELLIRQRCDVDVQNSGGATALHVAATKGSPSPHCPNHGSNEDCSS